MRRTLESRTLKLERDRRPDDEMLLIWRKPDDTCGEAINAAKKMALFGPGDKVVCVEWLGKGEPPPPRWCRQFPKSLSEDELGYCHAALGKLADDTRPRPAGADYALLQMPDSKLWHMVLGVAT
jgi:hypothetical protein